MLRAIGFAILLSSLAVLAAPVARADMCSESVVAGSEDPSTSNPDPPVTVSWYNGNVQWCEQIGFAVHAQTRPPFLAEITVRRFHLDLKTSSVRIEWYSSSNCSAVRRAMFELEHVKPPATEIANIRSGDNLPSPDGDFQGYTDRNLTFFLYDIDNPLALWFERASQALKSCWSPSASGRNLEMSHHPEYRTSPRTP